MSVFPVQYPDYLKQNLLDIWERYQLFICISIFVPLSHFFEEGLTDFPSCQRSLIFGLDCSDSPTDRIFGCSFSICYRFSYGNVFFLYVREADLSEFLLECESNPSIWEISPLHDLHMGYRVLKGFYQAFRRLRCSLGVYELESYCIPFGWAHKPANRVTFEG